MILNLKFQPKSIFTLISILLILISVAITPHSTVVFLATLIIAIFFIAISCYLNSLEGAFFSVVIWFSLAISSNLFFGLKSYYAKTGWGALGNYNFGVMETFNFLLHYFLMFLIFIFCLILFRKVLDKITADFNRLTYKPMPKNSLNVPAKYILILFALLCSVGYLMFINGIGMTGVSPPALGWHLSGILYYTIRYILPVALGIFILTNWRSGKLQSFSFALALVFSAFTLSRLTPLYYLMPILIGSLYYRQYLKFALSVFFLALGIVIATFMRNSVYDNLLEIGYQSVGYHEIKVGLIQFLNSSKNLADFLAILLSAPFDRLSGMQDMILGNQLHINSIDAGSILKSLCWSGSYGIDVVSKITKLFGFVPDGTFAVSLNFPGMMVALFNLSPIYVVILAFFYAAFFKAIDFLLRCITEISVLKFYINFHMFFLIYLNMLPMAWLSLGVLVVAAIRNHFTASIQHES